jgi:hypothetical protein
MYKVFIVLLSSSILFISCNNDDDNSSPPIEEANFYALMIGNSWGYEYFSRIGQTDEFESMGIVEDVLITETTEIDGETYFVFQSTTTGNINNSPFAPENGITSKSKRDSLGYLIVLDQDHHILFSNENTEEYLLSNNVWGDIYGVLIETEENITVESGTFLCKQNEIYAILSPNGEVSLGRSRAYYSNEIGEIFREISSVSNPQNSWEKRLVSFEIVD